MAAEKGMKLRVMFQDEARFGRMSLPYACWAPHPLRPKVGLALVREFVYEYAAVSPADGQMTCMMSDKMNTESMNEFLIRTSMRFPHDHILMVVDGASSHKSKTLELPENLQLHVLPPYSPELNPTELLWGELRKKWFANKVFDSLPAVSARLDEGMQWYDQNPKAIASLTGWNWILSSL